MQAVRELARKRAGLLKRGQTSEALGDALNRADSWAPYHHTTTQVIKGERSAGTEKCPSRFLSISLTFCDC